MLLSNVVAECAISSYSYKNPVKSDYGYLTAKWLVINYILKTLLSFNLLIKFVLCPGNFCLKYTMSSVFFFSYFQTVHIYDYLWSYTICCYGIIFLVIVVVRVLIHVLYWCTLNLNQTVSLKSFSSDLTIPQDVILKVFSRSCHNFSCLIVSNWWKRLFYCKNLYFPQNDDKINCG